MKIVTPKKARAGAPPLPGGLAGWFLGRFRGRQALQPRLIVIERVSLAPRHSLALVEAEGHRLLVATSADGATVFQALEARSPGSSTGSTRTPRRTSW